MDPGSGDGRTGKLQWLEELDPLSRRALLFARVYESARREAGQHGYRIWPEWTPKVLQTKMFKQCRIVVAWLDTKGYEIAWNAQAWRGYLEYAFKELTPTIPMPGQLKNARLLGAYAKSTPRRVSGRRRGVREMEEVYRLAVRPALRRRAGLLARLGLRRFRDEA